MGRRDDLRQIQPLITYAQSGYPTKVFTTPLKQQPTILPKVGKALCCGTMTQKTGRHQREQSKRHDSISVLATLLLLIKIQGTNNAQHSITQGGKNPSTRYVDQNSNHKNVRTHYKNMKITTGNNGIPDFKNMKH